jgi:hypothetical protein
MDLTIQNQCNCGATAEITVDVADFNRWKDDDGVLIQDAFPYLNADDRELIMSTRHFGFWMCPTCWDRTFDEALDD